jgi:hypothetical protein
MQPPTIPKPQPPVFQQVRKPRQYGMGCLALGAAMVVVPIFAYQKGCYSLPFSDPSAPTATVATATPAPDPNRSGLDAYFASVASVRKILKSPASAKFSHSADPEAGWSPHGTNEWFTWGWVDSQNSFGANLRSKWWIHLSLVGADYFVLYRRVGDQEFGTRPADWK